MNLKYIDGLMGFVIGDAMGLPLKNKSREELLNKPVTKMLANETYDLPEGTWGENTSLLIATIDSINAKSNVDLNDIALKFSAFINHAQYTADREVFTINQTTLQAITKFQENYNDLDINGITSDTAIDNGALVRILPIAYYSLEKKLKDIEILELVTKVCSLTHSNEINIMGCYIYVRFAIFLLTGKDKYSAYSMTKCVDYTMFSDQTRALYNRLIKDDITKLKINEINSSSNIIDTLEATIWVFLQSENYKEAIIGAINLGDDTSSIAALTGGLSGILSDYNLFPEEWKDVILRREYLLDIFEEFSENKYE